MTAHARRGPSGADRWMVCPGSPRKEEGLPEETSEYAAEGTAAHTVRDWCLSRGVDANEFLGQWVPADGLFFEVTQEWVNAIQPGIDYLRELGGDLYTEHRVDLSRWLPGDFGTMDSAVILKKRIIVSDFKFGKGIVVEAERNKQMMLYALGFWDNVARHVSDATEFLLKIDQPRVAGKGSEWPVSLDELLAFGEEARLAGLAVDDPNAPLNPGAKQCQFCRASRNLKCEVQDAFVLELLGLTLGDLDNAEKLKMTAIDGMTAERRAKILENASLITSWVSNVKGVSLQAALNGDKVPGFKAVATEGDRAWVSEQQAEEFWRGKMPDKDIYSKKLKSPAQMEHIAGTRNWTRAQELIHRPEGKPALVPESDKRPALIPLTDLLDGLPDMDDEDGLEDLLGASTTDPRTNDNPTYDELI